VSYSFNLLLQFDARCRYYLISIPSTKESISRLTHGRSDAAVDTPPAELDISNQNVLTWSSEELVTVHPHVASGYPQHSVMKSHEIVQVPKSISQQPLLKEHTVDNILRETWIQTTLSWKMSVIWCLIPNPFCRGISRLSIFKGWSLDAKLYAAVLLHMHDSFSHSFFHFLIDYVLQLTKYSAVTHSKLFREK